MAKYNIPVEDWALDLFKMDQDKIWHGYLILALHALVYALVFVLTLQFKKEKSR